MSVKDRIKVIGLDLENNNHFIFNFDINWLGNILKVDINTQMVKIKYSNFLKHGHELYFNGFILIQVIQLYYYLSFSQPSYRTHIITIIRYFHSYFFNVFHQRRKGECKR